MRHSAYFASIANNSASDRLAVANAHAVLARCCELKPLAHHSAALVKTANNCASTWLTVANAHAVLARL